MYQMDYRGLEYISMVDENLMCPICRTPLLEPVTTICDHQFCFDCLTESHKILPLCPVDRTRLRDADIGPTPRIITNQLDALEVRCPNYTAGCDKVIARSMALNHMDRYCGYALVECPEEICDKKVPRKDIEKGCLHWLATCPDCHESLFEMDMEAHRAKSCTQRISNCEECGVEILRIQSGQHEKECPEVEAACKWHIYGCEHNAKRRDLHMHAPECALKIMGPIVDKLQHTITDLRDEVKALTEKDKAKDRRIRFLESYKNAPSYSDELLDLNNIPDSQLAAHSSAHSPVEAPAPYDSRDQYLLSLLETQERRVDQLSVGMTELEGKQTVMLFNETIPIKEQLAEMRSAQSVIACHVRWLMNLRLQERRPGLGGTGTVGGGNGNSGGSPGASSDGGGGSPAQPRRLSDTRENITKL